MKLESFWTRIAPAIDGRGEPLPVYRLKDKLAWAACFPNQRYFL